MAEGHRRPRVSWKVRAPALGIRVGQEAGGGGSTGWWVLRPEADLTAPLPPAGSHPHPGAPEGGQCQEPRCDPLPRSSRRPQQAGAASCLPQSFSQEQWPLPLACPSHEINTK